MNDVDIAELISETEREILRVLGDGEEATRGLYDMIRYHLGLDGSGAPAGKRMRPLLGLLAYMSITGEYARALPGAAAVELGHNFSLVHDDIEDGDTERRHRATIWTLHGIPQAINTGDAIFAISRIALHRLSDLGFSDAKVLRLMRLYDRTCLTLCEGQYIDIATSERDEIVPVSLYMDMIGRKTAALVSASVEAGALLATDDEDTIERYRKLGWAPRHRLPAQRRPPGDLGRAGRHGQGAVRHREAQEDAAGPLRVRERGHGGPRTARRDLLPPRPAARRPVGGDRSPRAVGRPRVHARRGASVPRRGARPDGGGRRRGPN